MPALGAVVAYEFRDKRKPTDFLPPFVSMNYHADQVKEGCLDARFTPLNLDTRSELSFIVPDQERGRFKRRVEYLNAISSLSSGVESPSQHQVRNNALVMMESAEIPKLLKLNEEEKKRYGGAPLVAALHLALNILTRKAGLPLICENSCGSRLHLQLHEWHRH